MTSDLLWRLATRAMALRDKEPAENVNALDEVPNSTWFTNRTGARVVSPEEAARGPVKDGLRVGVAVALASDGVAQAGREVLVAISRAAGVSTARLDELIAEEELAVGSEVADEGDRRA